MCRKTGLEPRRKVQLLNAKQEHLSVWLIGHPVGKLVAGISAQTGNWSVHCDACVHTFD